MKSKLSLRTLLRGLGLLFVIASALAIVRWWPQVSGWAAGVAQSQRDPAASSGHDHGHGGGHVPGSHASHADAENSLPLSPQARRNLGLTDEYVRPVELQTYQRTISIPALIVERPGRTHLQVATPLTGVIQHVHSVTGETVVPGTVLFEIRLTHEDLVETQTELLKTLGELDVEQREIRRLEAVAQSGAIPGTSLLNRQYARDKLEAMLAAQREALKLHGLSDRQIDEIERTRQLLRELQVPAPSPDQHGEDEELRLTRHPVQPAALEQPGEGAEAPLLVMHQLNVHKGESVTAGDLLCTLADYSRLFIEGMAFEQDAAAVSRAIQNGWTVSAVLDEDSSLRNVTGLTISRISNDINPETRTLSFFIDLPNELIRDSTNDEGQRFISWKYRVGQRLQLLVPVEEWTEQLVVPVTAVARDGAEYYVFQQNGDHFVRVPVHLRYRDQQNVVIAHDGSLFPGDVIAMRSAHQLQMALKNLAGGGADPHAGHTH